MLFRLAASGGIALASESLCLGLLNSKRLSLCQTPAFLHYKHKFANQ
jgi:hypothetical protein